MPDSNAPTIFPQVSDRYKIVEELGRGGMGVVYKAYDSVTKRNVAVKTMWGDVESGAIDLFEREWTVLARLSHPNIVDILDTGHAEEKGQRTPYFVMPLLPGKTLDQIIKYESERLTVERVVEIMVQACRGLQAAHDQNLVHRDLKPSNIFVMEDDTAKIIDFGIAHLADSRSVTGIKGTLQYMAPEQADMSSPVSARSDVFALAVVCYEALTGRKPFARRTESDTIDAIRTHIPPPASDINGAVNNLLSRTVHKAMAKQPWHRFSSAKEFAETLQRALRNEPIERFDPAKIQPRIERAKKAFNDGHVEFAMEILTELESEGHIDSEMPMLRLQIEQSTRQNKIRKLLDSARTRMEGEEHPLALQKLGEVLEIDPENADALALRGQIDRFRSERQIELWFRLVDEHQKNQHFSQAKQALHEILKVDNSNTRARAMLADIEQTEQDLSKFKEEKQRLYDGALVSYQNGEVSSALSKLERGFDLARRPNAKTLTSELDAQYQSFYNHVRSERDAARNAHSEGRKSLEDKNIARALEICDKFLKKDPKDPMFLALKLESEEMQRQEESAAIAELKRRVDAEPDLDRKLNIIQEAHDRFPHEPDFNKSLKLIGERRDLVNSIVARARQYEERGQFAEATNQWDVLRNIYPVYPGLDFEVERLGRQREEHAHAEAKAHWMERIDGHFAAGEYARARDTIQEALLEFPNDKELEGLNSLAEQGIRRSADANLLLAQGRQLCAAKKFPEGLAALRKAERLDPRNAATRETLLSFLVAHAREMISDDWPAAEQLTQEAAALNPDDDMVRSLQSLLESHKRQETINNILVEARSLQAADDIAGALKLVEEGLVTYPHEVRLTQLQTTLRTSVGKQQASDPQENSTTGVAATSFQSATPAAPKAAPPPKPTSSARPAPPSPTPSKPAKAALPPTPVPVTAENRKPMWMVAAGVGALVIIGSIVYSFLHHRNLTPPVASNVAAAMVQVTLSANEPGAVFKVDGATVASTLSLKPGEHTGEASLAGYATDTHPFNVGSASSTPVNVVFTLRPSLPELRFSSAIVAGSVIFDDENPVDLQEGSYTKSGIAMGDHHIRVMDGRREVLAFAFNAAPQQIIKLTAPLNSRSGSGIVISSLSGAAQVYATPGLKGGISGQPQQVIPTGGFAVPASNPVQRISLSDGAGATRDLTPDTSSLPVLTVLLNGAAERTQVNVTSNVPDGIITINGRPMARKLVNGSRFVSLGAGAFDIAVSHAGYQELAPQHLVIKVGDQAQHLDFQLTPLLNLASLNLTGAPPEAFVFLGEVRVGTVNATGTFSKDVDPGTHIISVRKAGFEDFKQSHDFKASENVRLAVQMHTASSGLTLHVSPSSAKITVRHDSDIYTPVNGQTISLAPGTYVVTAAADKFETKSETVQLDAAKPTTIDWALQPAVVAKTELDRIPFANAKSWEQQNGWIVHSGGGVSIFEGGPGSHTIDIVKHKNKIFGTRRTVMVADYKDKGNYTQYGLDGRNLYKVVVADGKASSEIRLPFGQENGDFMRIHIDLSADSFTIRNKAGVAADTIKKSDIGKFGFVDDVTLNISR